MMENPHQTPNWKKLAKGEMDWSVFHLRARTLQAIRSFFESRGFLEVDPPHLIPCPSFDSNIRSMEAYFCNEKGIRRRLFLHTSPEHAMKKLLAAGADRIFFLGKVFRDGELTSLHNPEFTMVEWYRAHATYHDIKKDTQDLIGFVADALFSTSAMEYQKEKIDLSPPWMQITVCDLFKTHAGIDLEKTQTTASLKNAASGLNIHFQAEDDWESLFFRIFLEKIEPKLGFPKPTFVMDYPLCMGQMAKKKDGPWVERIELYIAGMELANGYSELTDPVEQRKRFKEEQKKKCEEHRHDPLDEELISALEMGIPPCAGIALGVDRLVMLFTDRTDIQDVLLSPVHQMPRI